MFTPKKFGKKWLFFLHFFLVC